MMGNFFCLHHIISPATWSRRALSLVIRERLQSVRLRVYPEPSLCGSGYPCWWCGWVDCKGLRYQEAACSLCGSSL